jgi:hypothetical protein
VTIAKSANPVRFTHGFADGTHAYDGRWECLRTSREEEIRPSRERFAVSFDHPLERAPTHDYWMSVRRLSEVSHVCGILPRDGAVGTSDSAIGDCGDEYDVPDV